MSKHENLFKRKGRGDLDQAAAFINKILDEQKKQADLLRANQEATATNVIVFEATRVLPDVPERRAA